MARGNAVLPIDQLTLRGVDLRCQGAAGGLNFMRPSKDIFQAADHLRGFGFVDSERIAVAGYAFQRRRRFLSGLSHHPSSSWQRDLDQPLLVLLGEKDSDTPACVCTQRLERARQAGSDVEWHMYPDTTHCWDCQNPDGLSKTTHRGHHTVYRYNAEVTRDSRERLFAFLDRHLNGSLDTTQASPADISAILNTSKRGRTTDSPPLRTALRCGCLATG